MSNEIKTLRFITMRFILCIVFLTSSVVHAQLDTLMLNHEKKLEQLLSSLRSAQTNEDKISRNEELKTYFAGVLKLPQSFTYTFSQLKSIGCIDSPDKQVRIINWNIELDEQQQLYTCFIVRFDVKKKKYKTTLLVDNQESVGIKPEGVLDANNWYGALYYKIVPFDKLSKPLYLILGWDGNNSMSTLKVIDVLSFSNDNPKFGHPIFKIKDATYKRVFFEHSKKVTMSLKYEEQYSRIVFDHLSPESPALEGFYSFYVPDFTYDAFVAQGTKWVLYEDVIAVNGPGDEKKTFVFVQNPKTGKLEKKPIKRKWQSPEDRNAPVTGLKHQAMTPDMDDKNPVELEKNLSNKKGKKDKRKVGEMSTTLGNGSKKGKKN
jgi:hypothetical protein